LLDLRKLIKGDTNYGVPKSLFNLLPGFIEFVASNLDTILYRQKH